MVRVLVCLAAIGGGTVFTSGAFAPAGPSAAIVIAEQTPDAAVPSNDPSTFEARFALLRPTFVKAWNDDTCAQGESMDEYVDHWIHDYYVTGSGYGGWFAQSAIIDGKLPAGPGVAAIVKRLDVLGTRIAIEWAKPNDCRKIATFGGAPSLSAYGSVLRPYLRGPAPLDIDALSVSLTRIETSVDRALR